MKKKHICTPIRFYLSKANSATSVEASERKTRPVIYTRHLIQSTFVVSICGHVSCKMRYVAFNYEVCHEWDQSFLVPVKEKFAHETTLSISSLNPDWCSPLRCSFKFKTEIFQLRSNHETSRSVV
jgi:hypothetical protein